MVKLTLGKLLTPPKKFKEWCESHIPTYEWKNKEQTILASHRKNCPIIKKRLTKKSRLTYPTKFYPFAIVLVSPTKIEIQSHAYWHEIKEGEETLTSEVVNVERFENGHHLQATLWQNQWHKGLTPNYGYMSGAYTNTRFYPNNWADKLAINRDMTYLTLPQLSHYDLVRAYKYRHELEYLQHIRAFRLADDILYNRHDIISGSLFSAFDMRVITRNWLKKHKSVLKMTNPSFNDVMIDSICHQRKAKKIKGIDQLLHYTQLKQLPKNINLTKFQSYLIKQGERFSYYNDYLSMLDDLQIPQNHDTVLFPKSLREAHDNAVTLINQLNEEKRAKELENDNQSYQSRMTTLLGLEKEIDEFVFLIPKDLLEIVKEGNSLHHCVGGSSYLHNHKKGNTTIVFIRKKDDIKSPYFTLEYRNKQVVQIQGKRNRENVPNEVRQAVTQWQKQIQHIM